MRRVRKPCSNYSHNDPACTDRSPFATIRRRRRNDRRVEPPSRDSPLCEALELNTASQLQVLDLSDNLIGQKEEAR